MYKILEAIKTGIVVTVALIATVLMFIVIVGTGIGIAGDIGGIAGIFVFIFIVVVAMSIVSD